MSTDIDLMAELRAEAVDTAEDKLQNVSKLTSSLRKGDIDGKQSLAVIRIDAHSIKSIAASFDMKSLKVLCHRFEDYFFNVTELTDSHVDDIQYYVDRMSECLEAHVQGYELELSDMSRKLPNKSGFDIGDISVSQVEIMLVMEPSTATKIVTRELMECGYRMVNVATTMDAIQLIPSMLPDAVIVSRHMPELTGIDLACALRAMPTTQKIPVAMLATDDGKMTGLPKEVPILRKGSNFADDVADVLMQLGIL